MNQVYEQLEHSHQLLRIWEKYKGTSQLDLFVMVMMLMHQKHS
jgi:hypothetical protein